MSEYEQRQILSKNLTDLLAKYEKNQKEVADAIRVSPQTFNTWCKGIAIPRMGKIQALADYFNVPKSALIDAQASPDLPVRPLCPPGYDKLDEVDRAKADGYIEALLSADKYKKTILSEEIS